MHARPAPSAPTSEVRFGRRLYVERRRAGLSQEALAKSSGLHRTAIGLLENGLRTPKLDTITALAAALGQSPGELIDGPRSGIRTAAEADAVRVTSDEVMAAVGRVARMAREEAGLDIAEVARRSALSPAEVEAIEEGANSDPLVSELKRLASALDISLNRFFEVVRWELPTPGRPGGYVLGGSPDNG